MYCPECFDRDKSLQVGDVIHPSSKKVSQISDDFARDFFYRWKKD